MLIVPTPGNPQGRVLRLVNSVLPGTGSSTAPTLRTLSSQSTTPTSIMIATRWRFLRQSGIDKKIWEYKLATQDKLRANGNSLQPYAADPMACLAYAFYPAPALVESNRQLKSLMRSWLGLLDRLKKLHQRPDTEIVSPLPDALRQPPPPPSVTRPAPPATNTKNENTNPPEPEPATAPEGESKENITPGNGPRDRN